jgi:hypothetical protein
VRDYIKNVTQYDARGQGCKGFSTSIIRGILSEVLHPPTILMGEGHGGSSSQARPEDLQRDADGFSVKKGSRIRAVVVSEVLLRDH